MGRTGQHKQCNTRPYDTLLQTLPETTRDTTDSGLDSGHRFTIHTTYFWSIARPRGRQQMKETFKDV